MISFVYYIEKTERRYIMTENMKKFLELVSKNEELGKKLCEADKEAVIAMAKELGIALTNADFVIPDLL